MVRVRFQGWCSGLPSGVVGADDYGLRLRPTGLRIRGGDVSLMVMVILGEGKRKCRRRWNVPGANAVHFPAVLTFYSVSSSQKKKQCGSAVAEGPRDAPCLLRATEGSRCLGGGTKARGRVAVSVRVLFIASPAAPRRLTAADDTFQADAFVLRRRRRRRPGTHSN